MRAAAYVKSTIKSGFSRAAATYHNARQALQQPSLKARFSEIYRGNLWQDPESRSGRGSTLARTVPVRSWLPLVLHQLGTENMLDAACGDFNWMRYVDLGTVRYTGVDIVPRLIARNRRLYGRADRTFASLDITTDKLPRVDVILCRDCLIHLSLGRAQAAISNFKKSGAGYLLCTTHTTVAENVDCPDGGWRSVNLQLPPFNFASPLEYLTEDEQMGKRLGLWRLSDI